MEANTVIKVKYGDTLRRLIAITYDNELEYDMNGLRERIISLFNLATDADLTLTYTDVDGDIVTLVDDDDIFDVVTRQQLNPFRINVLVNENVTSGDSLINSDPSFTYVTDSSNKVEDTEEVTSFADLTSKSGKKVERFTASNTVAAYAADSKTLVAPCTPTAADGKSMMAPATLAPAAGKTVAAPATIVDFNLSPGESIASKTTNVNTIPSASSAVNAYTKEIGEGSNARNNGIFGSTGIEMGDAFPLLNSGFQYQGNPIPVDPPVSKLWTSYMARSEQEMGRFCHDGVQCNGCGMRPIVGPRFKCSIKPDCDLCEFCFPALGGSIDYIRLDFPENYVQSQVSKGLGLCLNRAISQIPKPDSRFISHVTIMDGTSMIPSTRFSKIWRMRNTGDLAWFPGTQIIWSGGDKFGEATTVRIQGVPANGLSSGEEIDVAINLFAPDKPGRYISFWQMALPSGDRFGQPVRVNIQVVDSMNGTLPNSFNVLNLNLPPVEAGVVKQHIPEMEKKFPISDNLSVAGGSAQTSAPATNMHVSDSSLQAKERIIEMILLKELEEMRFKQQDLNKEILKKNDYDLEDSIETLCYTWNPLLDELRNMGFNDTAKNRQLLVKNKGSIKGVVMDLLVSDVD